MTELFAALEKLQRYDLAGAAPPPGAAEARSYAKGCYELHATGPVVVKVAAKGSPVTLRDLVVDPSAHPWKFSLERSCTVQLASATSADIQAWIVPLVER